MAEPIANAGAAAEPNSIGPFPDVPTRPVAHDGGLLALMLEDMAKQDDAWRPTRYWMSYVAAKRRCFSAARMARLRRDFEILSGFAQAGPIEPAMPVASWKRALWRALEKLPPTGRILDAYRKAIDSQYSVFCRATNGRALLSLDVIAARFPELRIPDGQTNGAPLDAIRWRGQSVAAEFVDYLMRVADLYREIGTDQVKSVIEIGPGLGWSSLAHVALNPGLEFIVNVDIPPTLYVSTQFLKSMPALDVVDYRDTRSAARIEPRRRGAKPTVYQLASWQVPALAGEADLLANAFSFYEMEIEICRNYAKHLLPMVRKGVLLHSSITGKALAHGPAQAIGMDYLAGLFAAKFPRRTVIAHGWNEVYGRFSTEVALLTA